MFAGVNASFCVLDNVKAEVNETRDPQGRSAAEE